MCNSAPGFVLLVFLSLSCISCAFDIPAIPLNASQNSVSSKQIISTGLVTQSQRRNSSSSTLSDTEFSFSLPTLSDNNAISTAVTGCSFTIPWATEYQWNFQATNPKTAIPTNSAGTRVETIDITTAMQEQDGSQTFHITTVLVTFPTPFTAGANFYAGVSEHSRFTNFFSTVVSLPQHTDFPFGNAAPSQDPHGYFFELRSTKAPVNSISYFRSAYPNIAALSTCHAVAFAGPALNPPGLVVNTQLAKPSLFTPAGPGPTTRSSHVGAFSTTLGSPQASRPPSQKSSALPEETLPSLSSGDPESKSKEAEPLIETSSQASRSPVQSQSAASQGAVSTAISRTSVVQTSASATSNNPHAKGTSLPASHRAISNATSAESTAYELSSVSLVHGEVVVDGNTLATSTTLTLGSGSIVTEVAMRTNSAGQTVVFGNVTTTSPRSSNRISHSASIPVYIPSAAPTSSGLQAQTSTTTSNASSPTRSIVMSLLKLWTTFCVLRTVIPL